MTEVDQSPEAFLSESSSSSTSHDPLELDSHDESVLVMNEADQASDSFLSKSSCSASHPLFHHPTDDHDELGELLKLNVYDVKRMNGYVHWLGMGVYHSSIEAYGMEYAYGAHDYASSGLVYVKPGLYPGFKFRKSIILGTVSMGPERFCEIVHEMRFEYSGNSYHPIFKNCNHFCDDVSSRLVGSSIPKWVNRLARLGSLCICFSPGVSHTNNRNVFESCEAYVKNAKFSRRKYCQLVSNLAMQVKPGNFRLTGPTASLPSSKFEVVLLKDMQDSNNFTKSFTALDEWCFACGLS